MSKSTVSVNGGAVSKIDRKFVMSRAWAIFRQTYRYPQIKFSDIGRPCFAWALRQAWVEAREAARVAAMTPAAKADRIETLQTLIAHASFIDSGRQWKATIRAHRDEIRQLQSA
jgi:carotenoid cleavage dioxygenase-like enzyme